MSHYRKKPVVIEAHRIGDDGWPDSIWEGVNDNRIVLHLRTEPFTGVQGHVEIATLEGVMIGEVGDWIIKGVKGEFYPCKPDIFAATYEPATPTAPEPTTGGDNGRSPSTPSPRRHWALLTMQRNRAYSLWGPLRASGR